MMEATNYRYTCDVVALVGLLNAISMIVFGRVHEGFKKDKNAKMQPVDSFNVYWSPASPRNFNLSTAHGRKDSAQKDQQNSSGFLNIGMAPLNSSAAVGFGQQRLFSIDYDQEGEEKLIFDKDEEDEIEKEKLNNKG
jgi:hypothetical protein